jgi:hypothetical protein
VCVCEWVSVCVCVYVFMHVCVCLCMFMYVRVLMCGYECARACVCLCVCVWVRARARVGVCSCVFHTWTRAFYANIPFAWHDAKKGIHSCRVKGKHPCFILCCEQLLFLGIEITSYAWADSNRAWNFGGCNFIRSIQFLRHWQVEYLNSCNC